MFLYLSKIELKGRIVFFITAWDYSIYWINFSGKLVLLKKNKNYDAIYDGRITVEGEVWISDSSRKIYRIY